MMHINQGLMSRHIFGMLKTRLRPWSGPPPILAARIDIMPGLRIVPVAKPLKPSYRASPSVKHDYNRRLGLYQGYVKRLKQAADAAADRARIAQSHPELRGLHLAYQRYHLTTHQLDALDLAYQTIEVPLNIAPASKRPFALTGLMTAHHWVNFVKVFGKYLFQRAFTPLVPRLLAPPVVVLPNVPLVGTSKLLNLLRTCLSSNATTEMKAKATRQAKDLAFTFDEYFPVIEKSMIMHALIFHIPDTICVWGPVRNWWCFPFERYER